jgi:hypothetical protein
MRIKKKKRQSGVEPNGENRRYVKEARKEAGKTIINLYLEKPLSRTGRGRRQEMAYIGHRTKQPRRNRRKKPENPLHPTTSCKQEQSLVLQPNDRGRGQGQGREEPLLKDIEGNYEFNYESY